MSAAPVCHVFDVQRFSIHDGPGIRTTVFLAGCPLRCAWCQNPEGFRGGGAALAPAAVLQEVLRDRDYYETSGGGVTFSGGEPLLDPAALRALLEESRRHGLHACVQTAAAVPRASVAAVLDLVDLFQVDLKHMDPRRHHELTGADPGPIHENVAFLLERGAAVQLRVPVVPGVTDDDENLDRVAAFLAAHGVAAVRLVPYHRLYLDKYAALGLVPGLPELQPPTAAGLQRVIDRLAGHGLAVAVDGA